MKIFKGSNVLFGFQFMGFKGRKSLVTRDVVGGSILVKDASST